MPRVFLSHATSDRDFVENEIAPLLNRHGIETWYSQTDIGAASNWERMIRTALDTCDWFLLAMSSRCLGFLGLFGKQNRLELGPDRGPQVRRGRGEHHDDPVAPGTTRCYGIETPAPELRCFGGGTGFARPRPQ